MTASKTIVARGNPDTAAHVGTFVPGTGAGLRDLPVIMDQNNSIFPSANRVRVVENSLTDEGGSKRMCAQCEAIANFDRFVNATLDQRPGALAGKPAPPGSKSQNGWPVDPPRSARTIPGTNVKVTVADGPAGDVLMHVLGQVSSRVESAALNSTKGEADDWGYANRPVRGSSAVSNHASATAVDINATRHGLGAKGTFSPAQVDEIHRILGEVDGVVRWGGDYSGRKDEMHFEINASPEEVARVAERLRPK